MNSVKQFVCRQIVKIGEHVVRNGKTYVCIGMTVTGMSVFAQTDATVLATNMTGALTTIAPVAITLAGFFAILRLAKRGAKG